jgi:hypothetical protein
VIHINCEALTPFGQIATCKKVPLARLRSGEISNRLLLRIVHGPCSFYVVEARSPRVAFASTYVIELPCREYYVAIFVVAAQNDHIENSNMTSVQATKVRVITQSILEYKNIAYHSATPLKFFQT